MKFLGVPCIAVACCVCMQLVHAQDQPPTVEHPALEASITEEGLLSHLAEFDRIASENGGNRAFGFPGFDASVDYVKSIVGGSDLFTTWTQDFPANFTNVESIAFKIEEEDYYAFGLTYSPSTSPEGLTAQLVLGPEGDAGCTLDGYKDYDVTDKIVLVQRGTCPTGGTLAGRLLPAAQAGAAAVIIYNNVESLPTGGTLSGPSSVFVPGFFIKQSDGLALKSRLEANEQIFAYVQQTQTIEERTTRNVFAETKSGDPNTVLMLGAHLDSVPAGAGINDDGSGCALLLELFKTLSSTTTPVTLHNKIRFAWWGAEEIGLVGSKYYTSTLPQPDITALLAYLNFDMVSRGYWGTFDGDGSTHGLAGPPGSDVIERLFTTYLGDIQCLNVTPAVFTGGSDYRYFMETLNKPVGGLHTGTGVAQDDCYHQKCDVFGNANGTQLAVNAKAAAYVLGVLGEEGHTLIPRTPSSGGITERRRGLYGVMSSDELFPWSHVDGERHVGCGHDT